MIQIKRRIKPSCLRKILNGLLAVFSLLMVISRTISGVHWLSDIIGGLLLSAGLVLLYAGIIEKADP